MNRSHLFATLLVALAVLTAGGPLCAQSEEEARQQAIQKAMEARKAAGSEEKPPGEKPEEQKKDGEKPDDKAKEGEDKKEPEAPKVITRPEAEKGQSVDMSLLRQQVGKRRVHLDFDG